MPKLKRSDHPQQARELEEVVRKGKNIFCLYGRSTRVEVVFSDGVLNAGMLNRDAIDFDIQYVVEERLKDYVPVNGVNGYVIDVSKGIYTIVKVTPVEFREENYRRISQ